LLSLRKASQQQHDRTTQPREEKQQRHDSLPMIVPHQLQSVALIPEQEDPKLVYSSFQPQRLQSPYSTWKPKSVHFGAGNKDVVIESELEIDETDLAVMFWSSQELANIRLAAQDEARYFLSQGAPYGKFVEALYENNTPFRETVCILAQSPARGLEPLLTRLSFSRRRRLVHRVLCQQKKRREMDQSCSSLSDESSNGSWQRVEILAKSSKRISKDSRGFALMMAQGDALVARAYHDSPAATSPKKNTPPKKNAFPSKLLQL